MNTPLRKELKKIVKNGTKWTLDDGWPILEVPDEVIDHILNLLASKMPEKKEPTYGNGHSEGFNEAIDSVKSILKEGNGR
jgi:hypothetical protein